MKIILLTVNDRGTMISLAGSIFCSHTSEQRLDMFTTLQTAITGATGHRQFFIS